MAAERTSREQVEDDGEVTTPWWAPVVAVPAWMALWYLTPGLHWRGFGALLSDETAGILLETAVALVIVAGIALLHRRRTGQLLARNRQVWLYAVPAVLAIALPFHYTLPLPVGVYMVWMTVSVFWQDYLTFGLLQSYLRDRLPPAATIVIVVLVFTLGHVLLVPDRFAPPHLLPALGILVMGAVCAVIRARTGTLHLLLALHLGFYFLFA